MILHNIHVLYLDEVRQCTLYDCFLFCNFSGEMGKGRGRFDWSGLPGRFSEEAIDFWDALVSSVNSVLVMLHRVADSFARMCNFAPKARNTSPKDMKSSAFAAGNEALESGMSPRRSPNFGTAVRSRSNSSSRAQ